MSTNTQTILQEMRKRNPPMNITDFMLADQPVTEADAARIVAQQGMNYDNRERIPEAYLKMCDLYVELCGKDQDGKWNQVPTRRVLADWLQTFEEWKQERLTPANIKEAFTKANAEFGVGRPGSLTNMAIAAKTKGNTVTQLEINTEAIEYTKQVMAEKWGKDFTPPSEETRAKYRAQLKARLAEIDTKREQERRTK